MLRSAKDVTAARPASRARAPAKPGRAGASRAGAAQPGVVRTGCNKPRPDVCGMALDSAMPPVSSGAIEAACRWWLSSIA